MHHILHVQNASRTEAFMLRVVIGNQPDVSAETMLRPAGAASLRLQRNAESGYIFYEITGAERRELGRCGYSDKRINEYRITLAPGHPFTCDEISTGGPLPLP